MGELCNIVKKEAGDGLDLIASLGEEPADVVITAFLMASTMGLDVEELIDKKRAQVRAREISRPQS